MSAAAVQPDPEEHGLEEHGQMSRDLTVRALMAQHPTAIVAAIDEDGLFAQMPPTVSVGHHPVPAARSALDLVQPSDRRAVIEAWVSAKEHGTSLAVVGLAGTTDSPATIYFFDATQEHGVYLGVIVATDVSEAGLRELTEIVPPPPRVAHTRKDEVSVIIHADNAFTEMLGWPVQDVIGQTSLSMIHPDDAERAIDLWMEGLSRPGITCRTRLRHKHRDGRWVWLELSNTNLLESEGYVECEMFDISDEMEAHEAVRASEQLLRRLAGSLPVGVAQFDTDHNLLYANERLYEILGAHFGADAHVLTSTVVDQQALNGAMRQMRAGRDSELQVLVDRLDNGARRRCTLTIRSLTNDDGAVIGGVLVLEDVTEEARLRSELEHRATYDALTGCVNRRTAINRLSESLAAAHGLVPPIGTAVIFVDLDDLKGVNDGYGHASGDALLMLVASRIQEVVRDRDLVGRLGGDEFLVVCPDVVNEAAALALAERVCTAIAMPADLGELTIVPTASVGVAWTDNAVATDADRLIARADHAMYTAKKQGCGKVVFGLDEAPPRR